MVSDCHGNFTWMITGALDNYKPEETAIIILGDAGFDFYLNKTDLRKKKEVNSRGYRIYWVRGNHEARPQDVPGYKKVFDKDVGGYVYCNPEFPNLRAFKDYGIYNIDGYIVGVIGGAYSVDKWYRLGCFENQDKFDIDYINAKKAGWFYNEQLSNEEMEDASRLFSGKKIDFIMSHTCPYSWRPVDMFLPQVDQSTVDNSMELWLDKLKDQCEWNVWLFGHYHANRAERPHVEMYYHDMEELEVIDDRWRRYDVTGQLDWWIIKSPNFYQ